jgi:hypothetical protein
MRLCVKPFDMGISNVYNFYISVRWNRALRELGEANPCMIILLCVKDCAHVYFISLFFTIKFQVIGPQSTQPYSDYLLHSNFSFL